MMVTSFRNLNDLKDYVVDNHVTIISGMTETVGDFTGIMAEELTRDGFEFATGVGLYDGKFEPVLIIPNIYLGHAIGLMKKWKQKCFFYDGMMVLADDGRILVQEFKKPSFFLAKEDKDPRDPCTEVILETGERARLRYA